MNLKLDTHPDVLTVFDNYPAEVKGKLLNLRRLIIETATEEESIDRLEETLKWGEPSYLAKKGSTIRIDWKAKTPEQYAMYFKCTSRLVPTFREVFGELFSYEGNRAIVFSLNGRIPEEALRQCISCGLKYHSLKKDPMLGLV